MQVVALATTAIALVLMLARQFPRVTLVSALAVMVAAYTTQDVRPTTADDEDKVDTDTDVVTAQVSTNLTPNDRSSTTVGGKQRVMETERIIEDSMQRGRIVHHPSTNSMRSRLDHAFIDMERFGTRRDQHAVIVSDVPKE